MRNVKLQLAYQAVSLKAHEVTVLHPLPFLLSPIRTDTMCTVDFPQSFPFHQNTLQHLLMQPAISAEGQ